MTVLEALHEKDRQRARAEAAADRRTAELCREIPALCELDRELAACGPAMVTAAISGDSGKLDKIQARNLALQARRADLLQQHGYRADEDAPVYTCKRCGDSGYTGQTLCDCVRTCIAVDAYTSAGLGKGLLGKTFENFSLRYYTADEQPRMDAILTHCRKYAQQFDKNAPSLLFLGKTGLGKTHLSAAIAGTVAQKGYRVLYESSQKLFDCYEAGRFGRDAEQKTERYEDCDLLIIDDLGAECATKYTAATFFNLLNTRLINGKPTIINTNLDRAKLEETYGERVLSRLLGEFRLLLFVGKDVRMQKLSERTSS